MANGVLLDPRIQKQFELGLQQLQPQFQRQRGAFSEALQGRGLGRSSTFAGGLADIGGQQAMAESSLFSKVLAQQLQKEQFEKNLAEYCNSNKASHRNLWVNIATLPWPEHQNYFLPANCCDEHINCPVPSIFSIGFS